VLVVSLVPQEGVVSALALHSATHNLTKVIGPSIGGVLLTLIGAGTCLLIQALTIICMLVTLFRMRPPTSPVSAAKGKWLKDIVEGVSYLRQNRRVFATILTTYSNGCFGISYAQFLPTSRRKYYGWGRRAMACWFPRRVSGRWQSAFFSPHIRD